MFETAPPERRAEEECYVIANTNRLCHWRSRNFADNDISFVFL